MRKTTLRFLLPAAAFMLACAQPSEAAISVTNCAGWFESGYVTWQPVSGATGYNVYCKATDAADYTKLDDALVRDYGEYFRADAIGLKAGQYKFKIEAVGTDDTAETDAFDVTAHDRGGFAHFGFSGVGAYNDDGTLKSGAKVLYVNAKNASTITTKVVTGSSSTTCTGLQNILAAYEKGKETTPLCVRILGTIKDTDLDALGSAEEGLQIKGKVGTAMNITIEGVGDDGAISGFGLLLRNATSVEVRNLGLLMFMDDGISIDTKNTRIWIHNIDLFYGKPGSDADQAKGDGSIDIKGNSQYVTVSYNHLWDSGKASLCGMKSESGPNWISYHHNWFDHSDSRHPRIRTMSVHVYNNYFDGNSKYGVGVTYGGNAFVENNYFRNCKYPMMISMQGSDVYAGSTTRDPTNNSTFSKEEGGMIKAFGNLIEGAKTTFMPYGASTYWVKGNASGTLSGLDTKVDFDAYVATEKSEQVPSDIKSYSGSHSYSNFDTDATKMYSGYHLDAAADVKSVVTGWLGAGRMGHGDLQYDLNDSGADTDYSVISALKSALQTYVSPYTATALATPIVFADGTVDTTPQVVERDDTENGGSGETGGESQGGETGGDIVTPTFSGTLFELGFDYSDGKTLVLKESTAGFFTVSGNGKKNVVSSTTINGKNYTDGLKMESSTSVKFTTTKEATLYVLFDSSPSLKINDNKLSSGKISNLTTSGNSITVSGLAAGTYSLTKDGSINIVYISVAYASEEGDNNGDSAAIRSTQDGKTIVSTETYTLDGKKAAADTKGIVVVRTQYSDGTASTSKRLQK